MTRNALNVAKVRGKLDPGNFRNMVSFLTRRIIDKRLKGNLFVPIAGIKRRVKKRGMGNQVSRKKARKAAERK